MPPRTQAACAAGHGCNTGFELARITGGQPHLDRSHGGTVSTFVNTGTYTKSGTGTTTISIGFNNPGSIAVSAGTLSLTGGLANFSGTTLTGGSYTVIGTSTLQFASANIVTNAAAVVLDGD